MSEHSESQILTYETKQRVVDPADEDLLRCAQTGEGAIELTPELLMDLARSAQETFRFFQEQVKKRLTPEHASHVRKLRETGYSWRAVARDCYESWEGDWSPPSNQIMGMVLCETSASLLGEDSTTEPWV